MDRSVDALKQVNLVDFLSRHYGLEFRRQGAAFACRSPFTEDRRPSFFVRLVKGHWLFKDFSSGAGGTIFDFVRMKERLSRQQYIMRLMSSRRSVHLPDALLHVCHQFIQGVEQEIRGMTCLESAPRTFYITQVRTVGW